MIFNPDDTRDAIEFLSEYYSDQHVNNNRYYGANSSEPKIYKENNRFVTMKQSVFRNIRYIDSLFENVALTGSFFENVKFKNSIFTGSSFANCEFYKTGINGSNKVFEANNFSQSNFEKCNIGHVSLFRTGMLNAVLHNCRLTSVIFKGSTLEGTQIINCKLKNCDFGSVNLDYTLFSKNTYDNVIFPFYQLAFIIGFADFINDEKNAIFMRVGDEVVSTINFKSVMDKLILYYFEKGEYFAVCNLYLAQNQFDNAKKFLIDGVNKAIVTRNFRLINSFCQLARYHGLIDDELKSEIISAMDNFIQSPNVPETQINYFLIYIGKIKNLLNDGNSKTVTLNYVIKTDIYKENADGVQYVNELSQQLCSELSRRNEIKEYSIAVESHSALTIVLAVIGVVADVATIASVVMQIVSTIKDQKDKNKLIRVDTKTQKKYVDARLNEAKESLMRVMETASGRKLKKSIVEVFQSLKTDMEELYSKDIMIYRIANDE